MPDEGYMSRINKYLRNNPFINGTLPSPAPSAPLSDIGKRAQALVVQTPPPPQSYWQRSFVPTTTDVATQQPLPPVILPSIYHVMTADAIKRRKEREHFINSMIKSYQYLTGKEVGDSENYLNNPAARTALRENGCPKGAPYCAYTFGTALNLAGEKYPELKAVVSKYAKIYSPSSVQIYNNALKNPEEYIVSKTPIAGSVQITRYEDGTGHTEFTAEVNGDKIINYAGNTNIPEYGAEGIGEKTRDWKKMKNTVWITPR